MRPRIVAVVALGCLALAACEKAGDSAEAKRMPKPPPPARVELPADLRIPVEVGGKVALVLDAARLRATPPDFQEGERRAWRLATLVGSVAPADAMAAVISDDGLQITMRLQPASGLEPVLAVTRRGELHAALVHPKSPFPPYHGKGGRLHRPGDPQPRVARVARILLRPASEEWR